MADRTTPTGAGVTGSVYMADVQDETSELWRRVPDVLTNVAGTNTITADATVTISAYTNPLLFFLSPLNTNTGAVTLSIDGLAAIDVLDQAGGVLGAGALEAGTRYLIQYDGSDFRIVAGIIPPSTFPATVKDRQVFNVTDTWNKPASVLDDDVVLVEVIGAGGGGARTNGIGIGVGGTYARGSFKGSDIGASVAVTIGSGGSGGTSGAGNSGGTTSFGSHVSVTGSGSVEDNTLNEEMVTPEAYLDKVGTVSFGSSSLGGMLAVVEAAAIVGSFGDMVLEGSEQVADSEAPQYVSPAVNRGGDGGYAHVGRSGGSAYGSGQSSAFAGNGGDADNNAASDGVAPGGGGGSCDNNQAGDGAAGRVVVTVL